MTGLSRTLRTAAAVVVTAGAITAGVAGPTVAAPRSSPALSLFTTALPVPPVLDVREGGQVALDEVVGTHKFGALAATGAALGPTPSFGYWPSTLPLSAAYSLLGGPYLGATLEVRRDHPVDMTVTNRLVEAGNDTSAPAECRALGLKVVHPMAAYFDATIEGSSALDECAPGTATHLHGGHTAQQSDGGPLDTFRPSGIDAFDLAHGAGAYTYHYANDQEAAGLWIHDHALGSTRFNPLSGLAAAYLVRDAWDTGDADNPLHLPANDTFATLGTDGDAAVRQPIDPHEIPLVLQDRTFNTDGSVNYPVVDTCPADVTPEPEWCHPLWSPESFGDVALVNGTAWPNLDVDRGVYRFRVIDGANARFFQLQVVDATGRPATVPAYQIGSDGGLLNAPVPWTSLPQGKLRLAPGQRADVLIDFRSVAPGRYQLINTAAAPYPRGKNDLRRIMQFTVTPEVGGGTVPARLRGGPGQPPAVPTAQPVAGGSCWTEPANDCVRSMFLNEVLTSDGTPTEVLLNNLDFTAPPDDAGNLQMNLGAGAAHVRLNTVEEWDIVNTTADAHPIHLHDTQFRIISRQNVDGGAYLAAVNPLLPSAPEVGGSGVQNSFGETPPPAASSYLKGKARPPAANETGWNDTAIAYPGQVLRILVPFGGTAVGITSAFNGNATHQYTGAFVWHCHILEHEENDMMQGYVIGQ